LFDQKVMGSREAMETRYESPCNLVHRPGGPDSLPGDGLNDGKQVLRTMGHLAQQGFDVLFGSLALRDIHHDADTAMRPPVEAAGDDLSVSRQH
jgi:hypothetical protein